MAIEDDDERKPVFHAGPWHIVQATLDADETWGVNGVVVRVSNDMIIPFMLTDAAMHFVERGRARALGVWNTIEEFNDALSVEQAKLSAAEEAEAEKQRAEERPRKKSRNGVEARA